MIDRNYIAQAALAVRLLPILSLEPSFALKGGTAINMFIRDMPRVSVDIDLVYTPVESREASLNAISGALERTVRQILRIIPNSSVQYRRSKEGRATGLFVIASEILVKVEPNTILRGYVFPPEKRELRCIAQQALGYEGYVSMPVMSIPDLYGGKICAALDRQHPRDLFDIKILFENEGITPDIRKAFVVYLAGHDRPMSELLAPSLVDMRNTFDAEFQGMTDHQVSYEELVNVRERLISTITSELTTDERQFLFSLKAGEPQWSLLEIEGIDKLPALQWKLANIRKMPAAKHALALAKLKEVLGI